jgi:hypothetical protein
MTFETNKAKKMNPFKFVLIEGGTGAFIILNSFDAQAYLPCVMYKIVILCLLKSIWFIRFYLQDAIYDQVIDIPFRKTGNFSHKIVDLCFKIIQLE